MQTPDLTSLYGAGPAPCPVSPPRARWTTRVLLPAAIIAAALGLLAYAARESFRPAIEVTVVPAVLAVGAPGDPATGAAAAEVVQAPGWIEADPYAVAVAALIPGVVREVLALEGERVQSGQVVARLIDEDARLARRRAAAELARAEAMVAEARALVAVERARRDEAANEWRRAEALGDTGILASGERAARSQRLAAAEAALAATEAAATRAESEADLARIGLDEADLALARTDIRAPIDGFVLQRLVEPGRRMMLETSDPFAGVVLRLYDPARLQARVDVPLADAAKVMIGDAAELTTEALPGRVFHGTLARFVHEANVQKNTVQVKITIRDPAPELKPEMLVKARITGRAGAGGAPASALPASRSDPADAVVLAPRAAVRVSAPAEGEAWVVQRDSGTAARRTLSLGAAAGDTVEVLRGLRPGDRVVVDAPATLRDGARVRVVEDGEERGP